MINLDKLDSRKLIITALLVVVYLEKITPLRKKKMDKKKRRKRKVQYRDYLRVVAFFNQSNLKSKLYQIPNQRKSW